MSDNRLPDSMFGIPILLMIAGIWIVYAFNSTDETGFWQIGIFIAVVGLIWLAVSCANSTKTE